MYKAEISADNPSCFVFVIDQSTSMAEEVSNGEATVPKCNGVSDTMNRWLSELSIKCAKASGVRDYYHIGVIGYGKKVGTCLAGSSDGSELVPISTIADNPERIEERDSVRMPVWFDAVADGGTPMCRAASKTEQVVQGWLDAHPDCFPPIVIHITDGEATDGDRLQLLDVLAASRADVNGDGIVNSVDLLALLGSWGPCPPAGDCVTDLDCDGIVGIGDMLVLLNLWG